MTVGEHVRRARQKAEMTQKQLADLSGIRDSTISQIEKGRQGANLSTAELLADALGISIDELVGHKVVQRRK